MIFYKKWRKINYGYLFTNKNSLKKFFLLNFYDFTISPFLRIPFKRQLIWFPTWNLPQIPNFKSIFIYSLDLAGNSKFMKSNFL